MSRYLGPRLRITRRLGNLIGLTRKKPTRKPLYPDNPFGLRKVIPPGQHGRAKLFKKKPYESNEYDFLIRLKLKQRLRFYYGITEKQLLKYVQLARKSKGSTGRVLLRLLEMRLDNIVFRLHMAPTIAAARQLISHGHILVNKKKVTIPSYQCRPKDLITAAPKIRSMELVSRFLTQFDMQKARFNRIINILQFGKKALTADKSELLKMKSNKDSLKSRNQKEQQKKNRQKLVRSSALLIKPLKLGSICKVKVERFTKFVGQAVGSFGGKRVIIQPLFYIKESIGKLISVLIYDKIGNTYFAYPTAPINLEMKALSRISSNDLVKFFGQFNSILSYKKPGFKTRVSSTKRVVKSTSVIRKQSAKTRVGLTKRMNPSSALILMDAALQYKRPAENSSGRNFKEKVSIVIAAARVLGGTDKTTESRGVEFVKNTSKYTDLRQKDPVGFREKYLYGNTASNLRGARTRFYAQIVSSAQSDTTNKSSPVQTSTIPVQNKKALSPFNTNKLQQSAMLLEKTLDQTILSNPIPATPEGISQTDWNILNENRLQSKQTLFLMKERLGFKKSSNSVISRNTALASTNSLINSSSVLMSENNEMSEVEEFLNEGNFSLISVLKRNKIRESLESIQKLHLLEVDKLEKVSSNLEQKLIQNFLLIAANSLIKQHTDLNTNEKKRSIILFSKLYQKLSQKFNNNVVLDLREKVLKQVLDNNSNFISRISNAQLASFKMLSLLKKQLSTSSIEGLVKQDVQLHMNLALLIDKVMTDLVNNNRVSSFNQEQLHEHSNRIRLFVQKGLLANLKIHLSLLKLNKLGEFVSISDENTDVRKNSSQKIAESKQILQNRIRWNQNMLYSQFVKFIMVCSNCSSLTKEMLEMEKFSKEQKELVSKAFSFLTQNGLIPSENKNGVSITKQKITRSLTEQKIFLLWLKKNVDLASKQQEVLAKLNVWKETNNISPTKFEQIKTTVETGLKAELVKQQNKIVSILTEYEKEGIVGKEFLKQMKAVVLQNNIKDLVNKKKVQFVQKICKLSQSLLIREGTEPSFSSLISLLNTKIEQISGFAYQQLISSNKNSKYKQLRQKLLKNTASILKSKIYPVKLNSLKQQKNLSDQKYFRIIQKMKKQVNLLSLSEKTNLVLGLENAKQSGIVNSLAYNYLKNILVAYIDSSKLVSHQQWSNAANKISSIAQFAEIQNSCLKAESIEAKQKLESQIVKTWLYFKNSLLQNGLEIISSLSSSVGQENQKIQIFASLFQQSINNPFANLKKDFIVFETVYKMDKLLNSLLLDSTQYDILKKKLLLNNVSPNAYLQNSSLASPLSVTSNLDVQITKQMQLDEVITITNSLSPSRIREGLKQLERLGFINTNKSEFLANLFVSQLQNVLIYSSNYKGFKLSVRNKYYRFEKFRLLKDLMADLSDILNYSKLVKVSKLEKKSDTITKHLFEKWNNKQKRVLWKNETNLATLFEQKNRLLAYVDILSTEFSLKNEESLELKRVLDKKFRTVLAKQTENSLIHDRFDISAQVKEIQTSLLSSLYFIILRTQLLTSRQNLLRKQKYSLISKQEYKQLISDLTTTLNQNSFIQMEKSAKLIKTYLVNELKVKWLSKLNKLEKDELLNHSVAKILRNELQFFVFNKESIYHNLSQNLLKELSNSNKNFVLPYSNKNSLSFVNLKRLQHLNFNFENLVNTQKIEQLRENRLIYLSSNPNFEIRYVLSERMLRKYYNKIFLNPIQYRIISQNSMLLSKNRKTLVGNIFNLKEKALNKNTALNLKQSIYLAQLEQLWNSGFINEAQYNLMKQKNVVIFKATLKHLQRLTKLERRLKWKFINYRKYESLSQKSLLTLKQKANRMMNQKKIATNLFSENKNNSTNWSFETSNFLNNNVLKKIYTVLSNPLILEILSPSLRTTIVNSCIKSTLELVELSNSKTTRTRLQSLLSRTLESFKNNGPSYNLSSADTKSGRGRGKATSQNSLEKEFRVRGKDSIRNLAKKEVQQRVVKQGTSFGSQKYSSAIVARFVRLGRQLLNKNISNLQISTLSHSKLDSLSYFAFDTLKQLLAISSQKTSSNLSKIAKQKVLNCFIILVLLLNGFKKQNVESLTENSILIQEQIHSLNLANLLGKVREIHEKVKSTIRPKLGSQFGLDTEKNVLVQKVRFYAKRIPINLRKVKYSELRTKLGYQFLKNKILKKLIQNSSTKKALIGFKILKKANLLTRGNYSHILSKLQSKVQTQKLKSVLFQFKKSQIENLLKTNKHSLANTKSWKFEKIRQKAIVFSVISLLFKLLQQKIIKKAKYELLLSKVQQVAKYAELYSQLTELKISGLISTDQYKQLEQTMNFKIEQKIKQVKILQKFKLYSESLLKQKQQKVKTQTNSTSLIKERNKASILRGGWNFVLLRQLRREKLITEQQFKQLSKTMTIRVKKHIKTVRYLIQNLLELNRTRLVLNNGSTVQKQSTLLNSVLTPPKLALGKNRKRIKKTLLFKSIFAKLRISGSLTLKMLDQLRQRKLISISLYNQLLKYWQKSVLREDLTVAREKNSSASLLSAKANVLKKKKGLQISVQNIRNSSGNKANILDKGSLKNKKAITKSSKQIQNAIVEKKFSGIFLQKSELAIKLFNIYLKRADRLQKLNKTGLINDLKYRQELLRISKSISKLKKSSVVLNNNKIQTLIVDSLVNKNWYKGLFKKTTFVKKGQINISFVSKSKLAKIAAYKQALLSAFKEGKPVLVIARLKKLADSGLITQMQYLLLRKRMKKTLLRLALLQDRVQDIQKNSLYAKIIKSYLRVEFKFLDYDLRKQKIQQQKFKEFRTKQKYRKLRASKSKNRNTKSGQQLNMFVRILASQLPPKKRMNALIRKLRQKLAFDEQLIKKIQPQLVRLIEKRYGPPLPIPPNLVVKRCRIKAPSSLFNSSNKKKDNNKYLILPVGIVRDLTPRKAVGLTVLERLIVEYYSRK